MRDRTTKVPQNVTDAGISIHHRRLARVPRNRPTVSLTSISGSANDSRSSDKKASSTSEQEEAASDTRPRRYLKQAIAWVPEHSGNVTVQTLVVLIKSESRGRVYD